MDTASQFQGDSQVLSGNPVQQGLFQKWDKGLGKYTRITRVFYFFPGNESNNLEIKFC